MEEPEQMNKPLRDLIEIMQFTENVSTKIHGLTDEAEIYGIVREEFAKSKRYTMTVLLLTEDRSKLRIATTSQPLGKLRAAEKATALRMREHEIDLGKSSIFSRIVRGETLNVDFGNLVSEFLPQPLAYLITKIMGFGKRRSIITPLYRHGKIIGAFATTSPELAEYFIPSVGNLARHISTALELAEEHAERKRAEEALAHERDLLHALMDNIPDAIYFKDAESRFARINRAHAERIGLKDPEEAIGKTVFDFYDQEYAREAYEDEQKILKTRQPLIDKIQKIIGTEGQVRWTSVTKVPIVGREGKVTGIVGVSRDITERKEAEETIRESEEKYRNLFENARDVIVTFDLRGNVTSINKAIEGYGLQKDEFIGKSMLKFVSKRYWPRLLGDLTKLARGKPVRSEIELITPIGKKIVEYTSNPIMLEEKAVGIQTILRDMTERKQAEETIRESEERYRNLFENAADTIVTFDLKGNITSVNRVVEEYGFKRDEVIGKSMLKFLPRKYWPELLKRLAAVPAGKPTRGEVELITPLGKIIVEYRSSAITRGEKVLGFQVILRNMTERKRMEEALRESEERYRNLVELAPDVIMTSDMKGVITSINAAVTRLIGYSKDEIVGKHFSDIAALRPVDIPKYLKLFSSIMRGKIPEPFEFAYYDRDGTEHWGEAHLSLMKVDGKKMGTLAILREVTQRKKMEQELRRYTDHLERLVEERTTKLREAERLAAIGETAAMVGHDLRNPLQVVVNTVYLAKKALKEIPLGTRFADMGDVEDLFRTVEQQVEYMDKIVSDLQDYARPLKPKFAPTNLQQIINETLSTLPVPRTIKVSMKIPDDFPNMMVDPALMKRVFTNLITNALQAMPDGGQVTVTASNTDEAALISVQDTGVGIPEENLDKLFQPLFTTKSKGQGFGLAVCRRMVEAHGGNIMFKSQLGKGSTFTVEIPIGKEVS